MTNRVALVTGGNRGIGAACARALAAAGNTVVVASRAGEPLGDLPGVALDVTSQASVDAAFAKVEADFGRVEVLVSNAGITNDTLAPLRTFARPSRHSAALHGPCCPLPR